ncbi:ATP-binding protein [Streptomyces sp. AC627_RSS907]|uniref:ATP-binding protein n=1 Tax=Streptomyces sp. AC627_RSS907 TaxID=2823684 RepID=UPI001C23A858|nr:ATP-binding protein [Streptomyces sp. AC627_RSS907]
MQLEIRPDPSEVGRARRWARSRLVGSGIQADEPLAETLVLLVSELVTNAVVHTGCSAVVRLVLPGVVTEQAEEATVRLEVDDASDRAPVPRCVGDDATGGRGLALVDGLADRWGWSREGSGKRIWCELDRCAERLESAPACGSAGAVTPEGLAPEGLAPEGLAPEGLAYEVV